MGAQLFGTNPYQQMSGLAAKHGGAGNGTLFDQQTAPAQYQQSLNAQGQAAGGIGNIMQLLAYMHQRHSGQSGNPAEGNPGLNQSPFPAPVPGQQPIAGVNQSTGMGLDRGGPADKMQNAGQPSMMRGTGSNDMLQSPMQRNPGQDNLPFLHALMMMHQQAVGGGAGHGAFNPMSPAQGQLWGSQWSNPGQGGQ